MADEHFADQQELPTARNSAVIVIHNDELLLWGGMTQIIMGQGDDRFIVDVDLPDLESGEEDRQFVEIFDLQTHEWRLQQVTGDIPSFCRGSFYAVVENKLYMYGGAAEGGFSDSLHCLHLETFQWQLIECTNGPTEKRLGGMVSFGSNLFTFGGAGTGVQFSTEHGAKFIPNKSFNQWDDEGWNNALHKYNIVKDVWTEINSTGTRPPPCEKFTFNQIEKNRAILFGGKQSKYEAAYNDVFILHVNDEERKYHWEGPHSPQPEQKWPSARAVHSAACLVDPLCDDAYTQQQLLVLWGEDSNAIHVKDIWILHIYTMTWKELRIPLQPRKLHMSCSYHINDRQTDVVVFGGNKQRKSKFDRHVMTDMIIFRFGSVESLLSKCLGFVHHNWKFYAAFDIPPSLRLKLTRLDNTNTCKIIYPHDTHFQHSFD